MKYKYAKSLKGHDKGKIYEIVSFSERVVELKDQTGRIKKKNRKHIQPIKGDTNV
jgi:hypothetical protein